MARDGSRHVGVLTYPIPASSSTTARYTHLIYRLSSSLPPSPLLVSFFLSLSAVFFPRLFSFSPRELFFSLFVLTPFRVVYLRALCALVYQHRCIGASVRGTYVKHVRAGRGTVVLNARRPMDGEVLLRRAADMPPGSRESRVDAVEPRCPLLASFPGGLRVMFRFKDAAASVFRVAFGRAK